MTLRTARSRELKSEYRFAYTQARPNRFAKHVKPGSLAVVLDPEVARFFKTAEAVNSVLRAIVSNVPKHKAAKP